jgi:hypothetical protein
MWITAAVFRSLLQQLTDAHAEVQTLTALRAEDARSAHGLLVEMRLSQAETRALTQRQLAEVAQQRAVQQQNVDWLMNHVNRLEVERSTLITRVLDIGLSAPQIARTQAPASPLGVLGIPIEDRPPGEDTGMALAALQAGSFEDMGDEAAKLFGVEHDRLGGVQYTK